MNSIIYFIFGFLIGNSVKCIALTENQIRDEIKFLSQNYDRSKPSRLRAYLIADLKKALLKSYYQQPMDYNVDADLKVTPNCTCIDYACAKTSSQIKRSRIQRSCKDYCCRRNLIKKSLIRSADADDHYNHYDINDHDDAADDFSDEQFNWKKLNDCQNVSPENLESFSVYGLVQIYQPKTKRTICMGSLIHGRLVVTSPDCASMRKGLQVKIREKIDKNQYQYQVRNVTKIILAENDGEMLNDSGSSVALLVLNKDIHANKQISTMCLPPLRNDNLISTPTKCFLFSFENRNGRMLEEKQEVQLKPIEFCVSKHQQSTTIISQNSLCAEPLNSSRKILSNGAPLICTIKNSKGNVYYQNGILTFTESELDTPYILANVTNFKTWIDKNVKLLEL